MKKITVNEKMILNDNEWFDYPNRSDGLWRNSKLMRSLKNSFKLRKGQAPNNYH